MHSVSISILSFPLIGKHCQCLEVNNCIAIHCNMMNLILLDLKGIFLIGMHSLLWYLLDTLNNFY